MSSAPQYLPHYTVSDYQHWEGHWELWNGVAIAMTPSPFGRHSKVVAKLIYELIGSVEAAGCQATVLTEIDWIVNDNTVVRPDVVVVCGNEPEQHIQSPPAVVVEVLSPGTALRDRGPKRALYSDHGVKHYLIVEPEERSFALHSRNSDGQLELVATPSVSLKICDDCELNIDVPKALS